MKDMLFAFAIGAALVFLGVTIACQYDQKSTAEAQGRAYLQQLYSASLSRTVTCMNFDTDHNGYVSCDAVVDGHAISLECAANNGCWWDNCNTGCKMRPLVQIQRQSQ